MNTNWLPITKVVAAIVGAGITWVVLQLGLNLGADAVNEAATAIVGILAAYLVPDKRVSN